MRKATKYNPIRFAVHIHGHTPLGMVSLLIGNLKYVLYDHRNLCDENCMIN